jgi:hypothetical protein
MLGQITVREICSLIAQNIEARELISYQEDIPMRWGENTKMVNSLIYFRFKLVEG